jgi:hypothetical protein
MLGMPNHKENTPELHKFSPRILFGMIAFPTLVNSINSRHLPTLYPTLKGDPSQDQLSAAVTQACPPGMPWDRGPPGDHQGTTRGRPGDHRSGSGTKALEPILPQETEWDQAKLEKRYGVTRVTRRGTRPVDVHGRHLLGFVLQLCTLLKLSCGKGTPFRPGAGLSCKHTWFWHVVPRCTASLSHHWTELI